MLDHLGYAFFALLFGDLAGALRGQRNGIFFERFAEAETLSLVWEP